jgi:hypothetical protein
MDYTPYSGAGSEFEPERTLYSQNVTYLLNSSQYYQDPTLSTEVHGGVNNGLQDDPWNPSARIIPPQNSVLPGSSCNMNTSEFSMEMSTSIPSSNSEGLYSQYQYAQPGTLQSLGTFNTPPTPQSGPETAQEQPPVEEPTMSDPMIQDSMTRYTYYPVFEEFGGSGTPPCRSSEPKLTDCSCRLARRVWNGRR